MFRCPRPLTSLGSVWTHRSQLLFATDLRLLAQSDYLSLTDHHLPVQSDHLSLKQSRERNVGTLCGVFPRALPYPQAEKRNHWRRSNLPHDLSVKSTTAVFLDALSTLSLLSVPFQEPMERAVLSDCLPLPRYPRQSICKSAGTQTCHPSASHDPRKATALEELSLINGQKPVHANLRKCLLEDLLTGDRRSSTSELTRNHVVTIQNVCRNIPVQTGLFHKGSSSGRAGPPWTAVPRRSLAQSQHLPLRHTASVLSAENEARCRRILQPNMAVYEQERAKAKAREGQRGWAAVLVSLCSVAGEPAVLFTLRSRMLKGRHRGDVSFAGGKQDPSDRDVVDTALREAREELGVTVSASSVWGALKPLRETSGMLVAPVLANLGPLEALSFHPNPSEVEEIFTISLAHVCNPQNRGYTNYRVGSRYGYTTPVFLNGKHRVWGLTAVALEHALKIIVPP